MLKRGLTVALLASLGLAARAQDDDALDALRRPERLTTASNDQFLGQLSPDERVLYYVTNQDTRKEIYAQDRERVRAHRVFDEAADVTWPRVSPNGEHLLYISFSEQATGKLCVRDLPDGEHRRCYAEPAAALQAEWIDDGRIVLVARTSIGGDLRVSELRLGRDALTGRTLFDRNWTSPAVSPDGRWLVYVPLDRTATRVGPGFAARTAGRLEAVRLDRPGSASLPLDIDLPGMTGQPAFSRDGRFLYFSQFFSDSNHDGVLDASDHGVLFRLPFESGRDTAPTELADEAPLQLTDSSWNCQYPSPARTMLLATCSRGRYLDVYQLPLDGQVPTDWTRERLRTELTLGGKREEQLLLYRQALGRATQPSFRRLITMRLVMAHLELEEFDAASFYAKKASALHQQETRGIGQPLEALVAQQRARSDRERGRIDETFEDDARTRLEALVDGETDSPAARVLNHIVRSEIFQALGELGNARAALESAQVDVPLPRNVLEFYYDRANALYRLLDEREELVDIGRRFAYRGDLTPDVQLDYARAYVRELTRGLPLEQALDLLEKEQATVPEESELGFVLALYREVLGIRAGRPEPETRARMIELYESQTRPDRQRAVILEAVQRAADLGADWAIECLAERYLDDVPVGTQERRRAERLYKRALMGRGFRRLSKSRRPEAQADFDAVYRRTGALEALVESIALRVEAGMQPAQIEAALKPEQPEYQATAGFAHAYLRTLELRGLSGDDYEAALEDARESLHAIWPELKGKTPARALSGALLHEQYLKTGDLAAAESAHAQYVVALELAQYDPRYQARVLGQLGLLNTHVGNHRIALDYIEQREHFPFGDDAEGLSVRLAAATARLHVGEDEQAASSADEALALIDRVPALARFRVLALDRAALCNLSARRFERALALYDAELPLLRDDDAPASRRNRFVVRVARAAAAVGAGQASRALADLDLVEPRLQDPELLRALAPPHVTTKQVQRSFRAILAGLRANANVALKRLAQARLALVQQRTLFERRLAESKREEDARALTLVQARLAANASARGDRTAAAAWIAQALKNADTVAARSTALAPDTDQLHVLSLGAELHAVHGVPPAFDVRERLEQAQQTLLRQRDPAYRAYRRWFEIYLALTKPTSSARTP